MIDRQSILSVIRENRQVIREEDSVERDYTLEENANYIIVGLRRAGKSTLLHAHARRLVDKQEAEWEQIIYINFEDERLAGFETADLNEIVAVASELTAKRPYYFFDEIQNVEHWEKFVRRLADAHQRVYVTGSNAAMLSRDMETTLGGRFFTLFVEPYSFREYLRAIGAEADPLTTRGRGELQRLADGYMHDGGLPETLLYHDKRGYVDGVYKKILLGDIVARNGLRDETALRLTVKKIGETVTAPLSYNRLHNLLKTIGLTVSKATLISYIQHCIDAYLLFRVDNLVSAFVERETTPRYYFADTGLLGLLITDKDPLLLENLVALALRRQYGDDLTYLKVDGEKLDIDFVVDAHDLAIQVAYTVNDADSDRELGNLARLAVRDPARTWRLTVVTFADAPRTVSYDGVDISVIPLWSLLLDGV